MGVTNFNKQINKTEIDCGGSFFLTLSLAAEPDIVNNPADIMLLLDNSGSMQGDALTAMKNGAKKFIDVITTATSTDPETIGSGSRIGIVSFNSTATLNAEPITDVSALKQVITDLTSQGLTNHSEAFDIATTVLRKTPQDKRKVIVMFTDGFTTKGPDAVPFAEAAKNEGTVIYCLGLSGTGGFSIDALNSWASDPDSAYVSVAPTNADLERLFENLAKNVIKAGATDIVIRDTISDCFEIMSVAVPKVGTQHIIGKNIVEWKIDSLGATESEAATLTMTVVHKGVCEGELKPNKLLSYSDTEGNIITVPEPVIKVNCKTPPVDPEPCPTPVDVTIEGCKDSVRVDAGEVVLESLGRILQLDVTLKNICPNKRVALAAVLTEVDTSGNEYSRGMKTLLVPAHTGTGCTDVKVDCIKFVLPESLDVTGDPASLCNPRNFKARFIAHYVDTDFVCCK